MHQHCHLLSRMFYCEHHFPCQDEAPRAMFLHCIAYCIAHCMAHCLNLCLQECASICWCGREALAFTSKLASLDPCVTKMSWALWTYSKWTCPWQSRVRATMSNMLDSSYSFVKCCDLKLYCEPSTIGREAYGEPSGVSCGLLAMMDKFGVYLV